MRLVSPPNEAHFETTADGDLVLAQYVYRMAGTTATAWELKGVAVAGYTLAVLLGIFSNRLSLLASDIIGGIKVLTLLFISITGLVVLGGHTSIAKPRANFQDPFEGTTGDGNGLANALVKITFAYAGFQNCFNVMAEVKVCCRPHARCFYHSLMSAQNPIKTMKRSAPLSLLLIAILYMLCNVAYFAAVPKEEILKSKTTAASLFFTAVFGKKAAKGLNILVILSAFGNLISVLIGQSRVIREIGRQGVLPYPKFWVTTKPFGTPIGPYILKWSMTVLMILAPPAGDAFNFGSSHSGVRLDNADKLRSGRSPELPGLSLLVHHGHRRIPDPQTAEEARFRSCAFQGLGRSSAIVHSDQGVLARYALVSAQRWRQWRRCQFLVCDVLRRRPWNVRCPYSQSGTPLSCLVC